MCVQFNSLTVMNYQILTVSMLKMVLVLLVCLLSFFFYSSYHKLCLIAIMRAEKVGEPLH